MDSDIMVAKKCGRGNRVRGEIVQTQIRRNSEELTAKVWSRMLVVGHDTPPFRELGGPAGGTAPVRGSDPLRPAEHLHELIFILCYLAELALSKALLSLEVLFLYNIFGQ
jgi:hypothetical protein